MNFNDKKWSGFYIGGKNGIFDISSSNSGIDKNKLKISEDDLCTPYITRSEVSNGINKFISVNQQKKYKLNKGGVITIGLDTQTLFFQPYKFYTGQNIQILDHSKLNKYNSFFLIPLLKIQMEKFNWGGNGATLGRLSRTKIMLPIDIDKNPDWQFMEEYVKEIYYKKQQAYIKYAEKCLAECKTVPISRGGVNGKSL
jgi:hypothetical protein